ncbi:uracil-DNA glycosylase [Frankia sp. CcI156]|uniref:Type-5 uracil-DNA glycosylase n=2 Tax=Frankia casuarinae (strain DSM 45818 / CECT 9043 / HFP020203 / CcI3) TaxID=106370 RepID=Q2J623_FRACC|nr:Uracil-DNA glycosylase superfamily [Frankia casuarinae]OFB44475.1 uracil-DNA glycosylase [Frankia sp. CgIM4]OHV57429.1 uracil-DNA glycosylase [Frankia sp. CgIS1]ONH27640.1 uracil-DNA glycosylase [Frankia sp. CcI156]
MRSGGPVRPGSGWPGDLAAADTPVAATPGEVRALAADATGTRELDARMSVCRACPRLVTWREEVAAVRRAAFAEQAYWGRPVPSFGPGDARILVIGLAPAAHGGNRTGRIFTGDRSGDWLFASLHRVGLAALPTSVSAGDGQRLTATRIVAVVRCAPPANKPTTTERDTCRPWLVRDLELVRSTLRVIVVLGGFAWSALWPALVQAGFPVPPRRVSFGHGVRVELPVSGVSVVGCYHPSQQNTFTGRVTEVMLDTIFGTAAELAEVVERAG